MLTKGASVKREPAKHRIIEVPADTIGKLDRAERRAEAAGERDTGYG